LYVFGDPVFFSSFYYYCPVGSSFIRVGRETQRPIMNH
jgi:hypothetical protein